MRYYYDTEFHERGAGHPVELISIGIVREDGTQFYAVNLSFDWFSPRMQSSPSAPWLFDNVYPQVSKDFSEYGLTIEAIGNGIRAFLEGDPDPELWAYFAAYDHVVFTQIFGRMVDQPKALWHTMDLKQEMRRFGIKRERLPAQETGVHRAIDDAFWVKAAHEWLLKEVP